MIGFGPKANGSGPLSDNPTYQEVAPTIHRAVSALHVSKRNVQLEGTRSQGLKETGTAVILANSGSCSSTRGFCGSSGNFISS